MQYYKRLPLENVKNARELGGVPTMDGKVIKWNKFLRTATLDDISLEEIKILKDYGVESVIDLRREGEIPFDSESHKNIKENFNFNHISLAPNEEFTKEQIRQIMDREVSVGATYRNLIDNFPKIRQIMDVFANTNGITLFHCQEGKDRTGIVSMILMGIANVGRADIIADYEISSAYLGYIERYDENEPYSVFRITNPYYMKEAYEYIERKYKSFDEYLLYAKVEQEIIDKVRDKLLS
ncbi:MULTISPECIES: tyrosine-protein phosphatase [Anaerococcus]|jgi:protein tyrosine/serine phosphatase|uniref:Tyrosine-protein phosphatase n=1 Tax=Anaerococcus nagyae TaxID=1755241 RepID=A0A3E2TJM6_9FIRM|nr:MULTISPECIES: tyrosine-protein phosphatase [Anaerococcus]MBP2069334.1 protein-tyrosine phosphatase [Anaerococcus nagyae]MDU1828522.1 tyrosine-protein phosphatase [Anaerococcus sp.]MDU1865053.1 tyrosine-protein phosphatase [Anaerococcus sp.]MDU2354355.1 tyrosine-protein phosphatase [Anaerococcus sp.]MDU2565981.1 tyrosine-protein phosphatase [Anaerococcus sp.]